MAALIVRILKTSPGTNKSKGQVMIRVMCSGTSSNDLELRVRGTLAFWALPPPLFLFFPAIVRQSKFWQLSWNCPHSNKKKAK